MRARAVPTGKRAITRRQREAGASARPGWYNFARDEGETDGFDASLVVALAGCGGGERQDASEKAGDYKVEITTPRSRRSSRSPTRRR